MPAPVTEEWKDMIEQAPAEDGDGELSTSVEGEEGADGTGGDGGEKGGEKGGKVDPIMDISGETLMEVEGDGEGEGEGAGGAGGVEPTAEQSVAALAKEHGLDLNNPKHLAILKGMVPDAEEEQLTEFEKNLAKGDDGDSAGGDKGKNGTEPGNDPGPTTATGTAAGTAEVVSKHYKTMIEAYNSEDYAKVNQLEQAAFMDRLLTVFDSPDWARYLQSQIAPHLDLVKPIISANARREARSTAVAEISKATPDVKDLDKLLSRDQLTVKDSMGTSVTVPDTPANRVLKKHPDILLIRAPNTVKGKRLTQQEQAVYTQVLQLRSIHRHWKEGKDIGKHLVKAGVELGKQQGAGKESAQGNAPRRALNTPSKSSSPQSATGEMSYLARLKKASGSDLGL